MNGVVALLGIVGCDQLAAPGSDERIATGGEAEGIRAAELETLLDFVPAHLLPGDLLSGAPNLTLSGLPTTIDTSALTVAGAASSFFVQRGDHAVLFTNAFTVQGPVTVRGARPLIVVAEGHVLIASAISLNAVGANPGPGALSTGPGVGGAGTTFLSPSTRQSSGGGGGGFGTAGANGGGQLPNTPPGLGGSLYGSSVMDPLVGGSRGGHGGFSTGTGSGAAGAGGGALQITSAIAISMGLGSINASGGGGTGGGVGFWGGGGGGSGGQILLEAPSISVIGTLAANGGGGGGGGSGGGTASTNGANGTANATPAAGGIGNAPQGSNGGAGAAGIAGAVAGSNLNSKGGGGGGGAGRIWLRYRAATPPNVASAIISPPAGLDSTLP